MSDEKTYTIAQLEWRRTLEENITADSQLGEYCVREWEADICRWGLKRTGEDSHYWNECTDLKDGKRQCQEHFEAQMREGLIAYQEVTATDGDEIYERLLDWRSLGHDDVCETCGGRGKRSYPNGATWKPGGIGGQVITLDVCDQCWGSGSRSQPWSSWRLPPRGGPA